LYFLIELFKKKKKKKKKKKNWLIGFPTKEHMPAIDVEIFLRAF